MRGQHRRARRGRPIEARPGTPLDGLLDDVRDLRLTLASDLSAAAGAVEMGADRIASEILAGDREDLARFVRDADLLLEEGRRATATAQLTPQWRRRAAAVLPAVPLVGAIALSAAAATGVVPVPGIPAHSPSRPQVAHAGSIPVTSAFAQFASLVDRDPSATQLLAAAAVLHRQFAVLIATNPHDPSQVAQIEQLLRMEQSLLLRRQPPGTPLVLAAASRLAARLDSTAGSRAGTTTAPTPTATRTRHHRTRTTTFSPSPSSTANPASPQPAPTATAPATASPAPTSSPTSNSFPNVPN